MSIFWVVLIDIFIVILSLAAGISFYQIIKLFKFDIPFTNEMIEKEIISANMKKQLLTSKIFGIFFTFLLLIGLCLIGAYYVGISGYIVFFIGILIGLFLIPPTKDRYTRSTYTIKGYIDSHSIVMDMEKFND